MSKYNSHGFGFGSLGFGCSAIQRHLSTNKVQFRGITMLFVCSMGKKTRERKWKTLFYDFLSIILRALETFTKSYYIITQNIKVILI